MNAVEFRELSKTYQSRRELRVALRHLSLDIPEGEIYGFAGPNGAGKSTSIKILVGLVRPTSGTVQVFGHAAGSLQAREMLGFLPEVTLYHEYMEAEALLDIHAQLAGLPRAQRAPRIREVLEVVGLAERGRSRIGEFSKGMKQRFGIAQAILARPKLLVLDELTSGLDPQAQANLLDLLQKLKGQGLTIFFSSHHLAEIEKVCDSVAIVHKGTLRANGRLEQLLSGHGSTVELRARLADGATVREQLALSETGPRLDSLRNQGAEILEMRTHRDSLEDLFHRLTPEQDEVA